MSGIATELVARQLDLPTVLTFHGLGAHGLRRQHFEPVRLDRLDGGALPLQKIGNEGAQGYMG